MTAAAVRTPGLFLACLLLGLSVGTALAAGRAVPYGGQFSVEQARNVVRAAAWLDGLEQAGAELASLPAVRLAGLDRLRRQTLAARLRLVEVKVRRDAPDADGEGRVSASAVFHAPDTAELLRCLGDREGLDRQAEVLAALRGLVPEALELAAKGHSLRTGRAAPDAGAPADELVAGRLNWLADQLEAYALYQDLLERTHGPGEAPPDEAAVLEKALSLAPRAWPLRLARAEMLLRQDRYRAALRLILDVPEPFPHPGAQPEDGASDAADTLLYVRGLHLRALAQLRSGQSTLAEKDLDMALRLAPEQPELWLARGAARQMLEKFGPMCEDYYQACARGQCRGLAAARERGQCLAGEER